MPAAARREAVHHPGGGRGCQGACRRHADRRHQAACPGAASTAACRSSQLKPEATATNDSAPLALETRGPAIGGATDRACRELERQVLAVPATRPQRLAHRHRRGARRPRPRRARQRDQRSGPHARRRAAAAEASREGARLRSRHDARHRRVHPAPGTDGDRQPRRRRSLPLDPRERQPQSAGARRRDVLPQLREQPGSRGGCRPRERRVRPADAQPARHREGDRAQRQDQRVARLRRRPCRSRWSRSWARRITP